MHEKRLEIPKEKITNEELGKLINQLLSWDYSVIVWDDPLCYVIEFEFSESSGMSEKRPMFVGDEDNED